MRRPEDAARDLLNRGRTPVQIRAIAIAMGNDRLQHLAVRLMNGEKLVDPEPQPKDIVVEVVKEAE